MARTGLTDHSESVIRKGSGTRPANKYKMASPTGFEIRRGAPQDAAAIAHVLRQAFAEFMPLYTPGGFAATVLDETQIQAHVAV